MPQAAVISPLLSNVYLHYAFDLWVEQWRRRHARGGVTVVRYADDSVLGFQHRDDAEAFRWALVASMEAFGLSLHPEKTRLAALCCGAGLVGSAPCAGAASERA